MAISNIQETLLLYTKQKAMINGQLGDVMFNIMSASRQNADAQQKYNDTQQELYYEYYGTDEYQDLIEMAENDHELALANLQSWESQLELQKNNLETKLNEVTTFESSWTKLLQTNIKNDFSYGQVGQ